MEDDDIDRDEGGNCPERSFLMFGKPAPLTMGERLDKMGPHYREVYGALHRALAIIEDVASSNPPYMAPTRLDQVCRSVTNAARALVKIQEEAKTQEKLP
jgi:hypothetical protein